MRKELLRIRVLYNTHMFFLCVHGGDMYTQSFKTNNRHCTCASAVTQ